MDWLAVFVIVAVVGQLCLPLAGAWRHKIDRGQLAKRRADLLEAAADRQDMVSRKRSSKLDFQKKEVGGDE